MRQQDCGFGYPAHSTSEDKTVKKIKALLFSAAPNKPGQ
jgi:hypothetical protein